MTGSFVLLWLLHAATPPGWCAPATARLATLDGFDVDRDPGRSADIDALLATLPPPLAQRAREDQGRAAQRSAAIAAAAAVIHLACDVDGVASAQADAAQLLRDPRFVGTRADEDAIDRLLDRLWRWIESVLASDGMQSFAGHTRTLYVSALFVVAVVVGLRLARRARRARALGAHGTSTRIDRERERAFAAWRADAVVAIDDDPRRAILLLRAALLARVGQMDADAVRPSRTSSEVLARLPAPLAAILEPALRRFDAVFFGGEVNAAAARGLLVLIDDAVVVVDRLAHGRAPEMG